MYVSHMVFDPVKEDGVNMSELLQSVYISWRIFNYVILYAKSLVPFNPLAYYFL